MQSHAAREHAPVKVFIYTHLPAKGVKVTLAAIKRFDPPPSEKAEFRYRVMRADGQATPWKLATGPFCVALNLDDAVHYTIHWKA